MSESTLASDRSYSVPGYELGAQLGRGGFGLVFEAKMAAEPLATVAVKILDPSVFADREKSHARFRKEASALSRLKHPNIVRYVGAGETTDKPPFPFLATELVKGEHFTSNLAITDADRVRFMVQVLEGLDHAHRSGLFHRDIKPSNLLFRAADRQAIIVDFGLVVDIEDVDPAKLTTRYVGSLGYVPAEVASGTETSRANHDIFSCGVTLYEALVGSRPNIQSYRAVSTQKKLPSALDDVIRKALDPIEFRYQSASEFARELSRVLSHLEALEALAETNPRADFYRQKAVRRRAEERSARETAARAKAEIQAKWAMFNDLVTSGAEQAFHDMMATLTELHGATQVTRSDKRAGPDGSRELFELRNPTYALSFGTVFPTSLHSSGHRPPASAVLWSDSQDSSAFQHPHRREEVVAENARRLTPEWVVYVGDLANQQVSVVGAISAIETAQDGFQLFGKPITIWRGTIGENPRKPVPLKTPEDIRRYVTDAIGSHLHLDNE